MRRGFGVRAELLTTASGFDKSDLGTIWLYTAGYIPATAFEEAPTESPTLRPVFLSQEEGKINCIHN